MEIALYFGGILGSIVLGLFWYNRKLVASKVELEAQLNTYKKTDEYKEKVVFKQYIDTFFIRRGFRYIKIWKGREKLENANNLRSAFLNRFEVTGLFSKRIINNLMAEIVEYNLEIQKKNKRTKVRIYTNSSSHWRRMDDVNPKPLDKIIIEDKDDMIRDLEKFLGDKDWYEERSILYKRV